MFLSPTLVFSYEFETLINDYEIFFNNTIFESEENKEIFAEANELFKQIAVEFNKLNDIKSNITKYADAFIGVLKKLTEKKETLKEEFAKIKREIDIPNLNPDNFLKLNRQVATSKLKLIEIDKAEKKRIEYTATLNNKIAELNNLWLEEYQILKKEVSRINEYESSLAISVEYKGRKDKFLEKLQQMFKGSGIRGATYTTIQSTLDGEPADGALRGAPRAGGRDDAAARGALQPGVGGGFWWIRGAGAGVGLVCTRCVGR